MIDLASPPPAMPSSDRMRSTASGVAGPVTVHFQVLASEPVVSTRDARLSHVAPPLRLEIDGDGYSRAKVVRPPNGLCGAEASLTRSQIHLAERQPAAPSR